jgi:hypothetical protein
VKCTYCQRPLETNGVVITLVGAMDTYTATIHDRCLVELVGTQAARKLRRCAFDSGWTQTGLPGFRDREKAT